MRCFEVDRTGGRFDGRKGRKMDTLSWVLVVSMGASWLVLGGALWLQARRARVRLARSARRCRAVMKELDSTAQWLKQAREQNVVLRERLNVVVAQQQGARTAAGARRAVRGGQDRPSLPTLNDGVEVGIASWRAFADTQVDEKSAVPAFQPTRPMNLAA